MDRRECLHSGDLWPGRGTKKKKNARSSESIPREPPGAANTVTSIQKKEQDKAI